MKVQYKADSSAYKRRLEKEKSNQAFKSKIKWWESNIEDQPTFDTVEKAVKFALEKTKKGERVTVWEAPKELGGKWKVISWEVNNGMGPESANQLGWSMIYDSEGLYSETHKDIDHIKEV